MALESLKKQMDEMDVKIFKIASEIEKKTKLISELEKSYQTIGTQLNNEKTITASLEENKKYLIAHESKCKGVDSLTCPKCMKSFSNRHNKSAHIKRDTCKPKIIPVINKTITFI